MMPRARVCILSLAPVHQDGRVLRQIEYASREHDVTVVGWGHLDRERQNVRMKPVERWAFPPGQRLVQAALMFGGRFHRALWERWYWRKPDHREAFRLVIEEPFDLIHVDEAIALPIAIKAAAELRAKVLFDAHEYSPGQDTDKLWWRVLSQPYYTDLIRCYAPRADAMTTVAEGIAERYLAEFGVAAAVIMNAPTYVQLPYHPVNPERIRIIHHATAVRDRHLEEMIRVVAMADRRFTLEFMLLEKDREYIEALKRMAHAAAPDRISFRPAVPPRSIPETINAYDIGLHLLPPVSFNSAHALPNKFFEFTMAGLALAIGPSPEMARIVRERNIGIVAESFDPADMARHLNALSPDEINTLKHRSLEAAKLYNAEIEMRKLLDIYERLLASAGISSSGAQGWVG
jgi:glycosyltransferase involved in cell wall biosynthesis